MFSRKAGSVNPLCYVTLQLLQCNNEQCCREKSFVYKNYYIYLYIYINIYSKSIFLPLNLDFYNCNL